MDDGLREMGEELMAPLLVQTTLPLGCVSHPPPHPCSSRILERSGENYPKHPIDWGRPMATRANGLDVGVFVFVFPFLVDVCWASLSSFRTRYPPSALSSSRPVGFALPIGSTSDEPQDPQPTVSG